MNQVITLLKKLLWKHKQEFTKDDIKGLEFNTHITIADSYRVTIGLFYYPIQKIIDSFWWIYELRLPRYELNDTFPINADGYTEITHSLLLERGRYHSNGPLLINNIKKVKFIGKKLHDLIIVIDMYSYKGHDTGITIIGKDTEKIRINNTIIQAKWKKQSTNIKENWE